MEVNRTNDNTLDKTQFTKLSLMTVVGEFVRSHQTKKAFHDLTVNDVETLVEFFIGESNKSGGKIMMDTLSVRYTSDNHPVIFVGQTKNPEFVTFQPTKILDRKTDNPSFVPQKDLLPRDIMGTVRVFESTSVDKCGVDVYHLKEKRENVIATYRPDKGFGYVCEHVKDSSEYGKLYLTLLLKPCMGFAMYKQD
ncbi:hypothetical protein YASMINEVIRUS_1344 [Yasminevirus sp. GU-2018]|uniref:Uncharacterized protein n=1 Tax=Yasminevirus sp. GU-2018 TaxID=2420051 RepID=A0A5K0UB46_9VIRU|nr:hypothetical protein YASMINEVIRUS_1344 [Yasminevirus sp. GU-2018]